MQGRGNGTIKAMDDAAESNKAWKRVEQARKMAVGGKRSPIRPSASLWHTVNKDLI